MTKIPPYRTRDNDAEPQFSFTAIVALLVAWSAIVFMFGFVVGQAPS